MSPSSYTKYGENSVFCTIYVANLGHTARLLMVVVHSCSRPHVTPLVQLWDQSEQLMALFGHSVLVPEAALPVLQCASHCPV
jgi:hypothetical protein